MLIGGLARSFVTAIGVYLVSLFFAPTPIEHPFIVLYMALFVSLSFSSAGALVALFAEQFEHLTICTTFIITPLIFFGGVFHSVTMLPEVLQKMTEFNPIFYMVNGMRYGMLGVSGVQKHLHSYGQLRYLDQVCRWSDLGDVIQCTPTYL